MRPGLTSYLKFLFDPFFKWWWAAITGLASILGLLITPKTGVTLSQPAVFALTFCSMGMLFLVVTTVSRGWELYKYRFPEMTVVAMQKSKEFGGEFVVVIRSATELTRGMIVELRRPLEYAEVPFALVEIKDQTSNGNYQALPIWSATNHKERLFRG